MLRAPDASYAEEASWQRLTDGIVPVDALVTCLPSGAPEDNSGGSIRTAWLGTEYALALFAGGASGIVLTVGHLPAVDDAAPSSDAALESLRILTGAALLDAQKAGIALRSNRLFCAPEVDDAAFRETMMMLCDGRARFMPGGEIQPPAVPSAGADARLDGKTMLVTGATSGIGRFAAIEIGRLGGWVALGGRKLDLAEETLALVRQAGGDRMIVALDVTQADAWAAAADQIDAAARCTARHGTARHGTARHGTARHGTARSTMPASSTTARTTSSA